MTDGRSTRYHTTATKSSINTYTTYRPTHKKTKTQETQPKIAEDIINSVAVTLKLVCNTLFLKMRKSFDLAWARIPVSCYSQYYKADTITGEHSNPDLRST